MSHRAPDPLPDGPHGFRRRQVLVFGGLVGAAGVLARFDSPVTAPSLDALSDRVSLNFRARLLRAEDMVDLEYRFYNLILGGDGKNLVKKLSTDPAFVVVGFGAQAVGEETFKETATSVPVVAPADVRAILAGETRLAFEVIGDDLPFNDAALLNFRNNMLPSIAPHARFLVPGAEKPKPRAPQVTETAIEFPFGLQLSTNELSTWINATYPVVGNERTELWHTRLAYRFLGAPSEEPHAMKSVRAIWSPGMDLATQSPGTSPQEELDLKLPLERKERYEIVRLSSDFRKRDIYEPQPVRMKTMMLTSLGGWLDGRGVWDAATARDQAGMNVAVEEWVERATMGREHFVKVVSQGYLYPFGHKAVKIKVSERKLSEDLTQPAVAAIIQKEFIVVRQPERSFKDKEMPWRTVRLTTLVTPPLDAEQAIVSGVDADEVHWVRVGNADFRFNLVATDHQGRPIEASLPLVFVRATSNTLTTMTSLSSTYNHSSNEARRTTALNGQRMAFAPAAADGLGNTEMETGQIVFRGYADVPKVVGDPRFGVAMKSARVAIPGAPGAGPNSARAHARARRAGSSDPASLLVEFSEAYKKHGMDAAKNAMQSFLQVPADTAAAAVDYGADAAGDAVGGLAQPNMAVREISRLLGPVGEMPDFTDLDHFLDNPFPGSLFNGARFLGIELEDVIMGILPESVTKLIELLEDVRQDISLAAEVGKELAKLPKTVDEIIYEQAGGPIAGRANAAPTGVSSGYLPGAIPKELVKTVHFEPTLTPDPLGIFDPRMKTVGGKKVPTATLLLDAVTRVPMNPPGAPTMGITGDLRKFDLRLVGKDAFIIIKVNRLSFEVQGASKPNVDVDIDDVVFGGPLVFVNELRKLLSSPGNGLAIDLKPSGVTASYTVGFPSFNVGAFQLSDIAFSGGVSIPFNDEKLAGRFALCSKEKPMLLAYTIFAGGAYFEIEIGADGVHSLMAGIEFGGTLGINLGVASGKVLVMAGIYFDMQGKDKLELGGYVRLRGELDVMGLISASLTFNLTLAYDVINEEAWGRATLTVEVDVVCFSGSVEIECERRFSTGGASGNRVMAGRAFGEIPQQRTTFEALISQDVWTNEYAAGAGSPFAAAAF